METLISISAALVTIIGGVAAFLKWVLPRVRGYFDARRREREELDRLLQMLEKTSRDTVDVIKQIVERQGQLADDLTKTSDAVKILRGLVQVQADGLKSAIHRETMQQFDEIHMDIDRLETSSKDVESRVADLEHVITDTELWSKPFYHEPEAERIKQRVQDKLNAEGDKGKSPPVEPRGR